MRGVSLLIIILSITLVLLLIPRGRGTKGEIVGQNDTGKYTDAVGSNTAGRLRAQRNAPGGDAKLANSKAASRPAEKDRRNAGGALSSEVAPEMSFQVTSLQSTGEYISLDVPYEAAVAPGTNQPQRLKLLRQSLDLHRTEVSNLVVRVYYAAEAPPDAREFWDSVANPRFQRVQIEIDGALHPHPLFVNPLWHHGELLGWRINGWTENEVRLLVASLRSPD